MFVGTPRSRLKIAAMSGLLGSDIVPPVVKSEDGQRDWLRSVKYRPVFSSMITEYDTSIGQHRGRAADWIKRYTWLCFGSKSFWVM